ncbi:MAG: hypothetical protein ACRCYU_23390 [Nocardioides sp.]
MSRSRHRTAVRRRPAEVKRLVPTGVAELLGIRAAILSGWMHQSGVREPIRSAEAQLWRDPPSTQPEWLRFRIRAAL